MKFTMYKNSQGEAVMISYDDAFEVVRELGHTFCVSMAELGHDIEEQTDLMKGLAAYHILDLKGENPKLDTAHDIVMREATDAMFEQLQDQYGS